MASKNFRFAVVTKGEILQMLTFLECVVLSPRSYMLIQLFSSISVNSDLKDQMTHNLFFAEKIKIR